MKHETNFMGKDGFYWWVGVCEDRMDPLFLGRLRVRVLGAHTDDKTKIPTCELQWAYPYQGLTDNLAMNGLGHSPIGPVEGTWLYGFYKDAGSAQDPIVLGVLGGVPEQAPQPCTGFFDPSLPFHNFNTAPRKIKSRWYPNDGTGAHLIDEKTASLYPRATNPWGCIIGEPDTNRLARAQMVDDTIIGVRRRQCDVHVPIAFAHVTPARQWNEQQTSYNAVYPYNHVYESESGHVFEVDDTPGAERLHYYHRSGTYIEINGGTAGDFQMKVVGKRFEVTMENSYSHYQNTMNLTVDGETNIYVRNNCNVQVDGNLEVDVGGNYIEKVQGDYLTDIKGKRIVKIGKTEELNVDQSRDVKIGASDDLNVGGNLTVAVGGDIEMSARGDYDIFAGGDYQESASNIENNADNNITESCGQTYGVVAGERIVSATGGYTWLANELVSPAGSPSPGSGGSPSGPVAPDTPVVPPFPIPLTWIETRNESGPDPVLEAKPDPSPTTCGSQGNC